MSGVPTGLQVSAVSGGVWVNATDPAPGTNDLFRVTLTPAGPGGATATSTSLPVWIRTTDGTTYSATMAVRDQQTQTFGAESTAATGIVSSAVAPTEEWHQQAGTAGHPGSGRVAPVGPLRWLWSDGPDANGGTSTWRGMVPPEAWVTGARLTSGGGWFLFVPRGGQGLWAYNLATGAIVWRFHKDALASVAYCPSLNCVVYGGPDGHVYKLNADTGNPGTMRSYSVGSPVQKATIVADRFAYVSCADGSLHKLNLGTSQTATITSVWRYDGGASAGKRAETPPAYSASAGRIVYATSDGAVHGVLDSSGAGWRVVPHTVTWGGTNRTSWFNTWDWGWPVVFDAHGVVLLRCQLNGDVAGAMPKGPSGAGQAAGQEYPNTDTVTAGPIIRTYFGTRASPGSGAAFRSLFAINLADGSEAFVPTAGYSSVEDQVNGNSYGVMGAQPVRLLADGDEVAIAPFRNHSNGSNDYRWERNLGEMVLDGTTVSPLVAGDFRFVRMGNHYAGGTGYVKIVDECSPLTVFGTASGALIVFAAHWGAIESVLVTDRNDSLGTTFAAPIAATPLETVVLSKRALGTFDPANRRCTNNGNGNIAGGTRSWLPPTRWVNWGDYDQPPGAFSTTAMTNGHSPRLAFVVGPYLVISGNGGDITVFRHSASGASFSTPAVPNQVQVTGPSSVVAGETSDYFTVSFYPDDAILPSGSVIVTPTPSLAGTTIRNNLDTATITTVTLDTNNPNQRFRLIPPSNAGGSAMTVTITTNTGLPGGSITVPVRQARSAIALGPRVGF